MKIYVASSWRNAHQPVVVDALRAVGHEVYDFRNPGPGDYGFSWSAIDPGWETWTTEEYIEGLRHPLAQRGFDKDFAAMRWSDAFVLVQPCGRSAHLELGWAVGAGKLSAILLAEGQEPELMVAMVDHLATSLDDLIEWLQHPRESAMERLLREEFLRGNVTDLQSAERAVRIMFGLDTP